MGFLKERACSSNWHTNQQKMSKNYGLRCEETFHPVGDVWGKGVNDISSNEALYCHQSRFYNTLMRLAIQGNLEVIHVSYTNINLLIFFFIFLSIKKSTHAHILYFLKIFDFSFSHLLWLGEQHFSKMKSSRGTFNEGNYSSIKCNTEKRLLNRNKWSRIPFALQTLVGSIIFWIDFIENCQEQFFSEVFYSDAIYSLLYFPQTSIVSDIYPLT